MRLETVAARDRISIDIQDIKPRLEAFRSDAAWRELSLAGKMRALTIDYMDQAGTVGQQTGAAEPQSETLDLLLGFLNYLIDHFDHDGYSLAEISQLLGRPDDKGLVALVQKLQNGQGQAKTGAKAK